MYSKEKITELSEKFIATEDDAVFVEILKEVTPLINKQLQKNYKGIEPFWEDLCQLVLLRLWRNRRGLLTTKTEKPDQYFYSRIRYYLNWFAKKIVSEFYRKDTIYFEDLSEKEKFKLGLVTFPEQEKTIE